MGRNPDPQKHDDGGHTLEMLNIYIYILRCLDLPILDLDAGESTSRYSGPLVAEHMTPMLQSQLLVILVLKTSSS